MLVIFKYHTRINISGDSKLRLKKELAVERGLVKHLTAAEHELGFSEIHKQT